MSEDTEQNEGRTEQRREAPAQPASGRPRWRRVYTEETARELEYKEVRPGRLPGDRFVRIVRPHAKEFKRHEAGYLIATEEARRPRSVLGRAWVFTKRSIIGPPLASDRAPHERLSKLKALAVLSSDALSSSAYATEEILVVLVLAGSGALGLTIPISLAIAALLAIVAFSYRQTIAAYPKGGGSYIVTKDNLGTAPALVAGSALLIDYTLTVAVSISAGVANFTSAAPFLFPFRVELAVFFIVLITVINLRGIREAGTIFSAPTYLFIASVLVMIFAGLFRAFLGGNAAPPPVLQAAEPLTIFLILRAFSSGCAALTGVEAISDGVPAFKPPEAGNARITLSVMAVTLGVLFLGISVLAHQFGIVPLENQTVVSQIARAVFGAGIPYYVIQGATLLILILAANTSFSDFPRLSYFLARDKFLPAQFTLRGDRLAFSIGTITLAALATVLVIAFGASTNALIPLYAVGVFISFTLSQSSMVTRWFRIKGKAWKRSMAINALGAVTTGVVATVIASTKFLGGAWIVLVLLPFMVFILLNIRKHYLGVAAQLTVEQPTVALPEVRKHRVIVPVAGLDRSVLVSLAYAESISDDVTAVHVTDDHSEAEELRKKWESCCSRLPLVILESPYRMVVAPLVSYIEALKELDKTVHITVVLTELVPHHWWEYPLHNQTALRLKANLFFRRNVAVVDVPYHL